MSDETASAEFLAAMRQSATFTNRFYVYVSNGMTRMSFGETVSQDETKIHSSVIMSNAGAKVLVDLITRLLEQSEEKEKSGESKPKT